ncbi:MAG: LOG family protein, partial [Elusimicrobia bacterium]|nr:LOG family protein [Elusimicrobiota bacterium]
YVNLDRLTELSSCSELFDKFYSVNVERNEYFIKNIFGEAPLSQNKNEKIASHPDPISKTIASLENAKDIAVVVTGGFHTEGFAKILEDRNISYLVITPNVTNDTKFAKSVYDQLAKKYAKEFASQTVALPAFAKGIEKLNAHGKEVEITKAYVEAALRIELAKRKDLKPEKIAQEMDKLVKELSEDKEFNYLGIGDFSYDKDSSDAKTGIYRFRYMLEGVDITIVWNTKTEKVEVSKESAPATMNSTYQDYYEIHKEDKNLPESWERWLDKAKAFEILFKGKGISANDFIKELAKDLEVSFDKFVEPPLKIKDDIKDAKLEEIAKKYSLDFLKLKENINYYLSKRDCEINHINKNENEVKSFWDPVVRGDDIAKIVQILLPLHSNKSSETGITLILTVGKLALEWSRQIPGVNIEGLIPKVYDLLIKEFGEDDVAIEFGALIKREIKKMGSALQTEIPKFIQKFVHKAWNIVHSEAPATIDSDKKNQIIKDVTSSETATNIVNKKAADLAEIAHRHQERNDGIKEFTDSFLGGFGAFLAFGILFAAPVLQSIMQGYYIYSLYSIIWTLVFVAPFVLGVVLKIIGVGVIGASKIVERYQKSMYEIDSEIAAENAWKDKYFTSYKLVDPKLNEYLDTYKVPIKRKRVVISGQEEYVGRALNNVIADNIKTYKNPEEILSYVTLYLEMFFVTNLPLDESFQEIDKYIVSYLKILESVSNNEELNKKVTDSDKQNLILTIMKDLHAWLDATLEGTSFRKLNRNQKTEILRYWKSQLDKIQEKTDLDKQFDTWGDKTGKLEKSKPEDTGTMAETKRNKNLTEPATYEEFMIDLRYGLIRSITDEDKDPFSFGRKRWVYPNNIESENVSEWQESKNQLRDEDLDEVFSYLGNKDCIDKWWKDDFIDSLAEGTAGEEAVKIERIKQTLRILRRLCQVYYSPRFEAHELMMLAKAVMHGKISLTDAAAIFVDEHLVHVLSSFDNKIIRTLGEAPKKDAQERKVTPEKLAYLRENEPERMEGSESIIGTVARVIKGELEQLLLFVNPNFFVVEKIARELHAIFNIQHYLKPLTKPGNGKDTSENPSVMMIMTEYFKNPENRAKWALPEDFDTWQKRAEECVKFFGSRANADKFLTHIAEKIHMSFDQFIEGDLTKERRKAIPMEALDEMRHLGKNLSLWKELAKQLCSYAAVRDCEHQQGRALSSVVKQFEQVFDSWGKPIEGDILSDIEASMKQTPDLKGKVGSARETQENTPATFDNQPNKKSGESPMATSNINPISEDKFNKELIMASKFLEEIDKEYPGDIIAVLGGSALVENTDAYNQVVNLGKVMAGKKFVPATGGGKGAMKAAHEGYAIDGKGEKPVISVPTPPRGGFVKENRYAEKYAVTDKKVGEDDHFYFGANIVFRTGIIVHGAIGAIAVTGGWGTLYEVFEMMRQNIPFVLFGTTYWQPIMDQLKESDLGKSGNFVMPKITDSPEEAIRYIVEENNKINEGKRQARMPSTSKDNIQGMIEQAEKVKKAEALEKAIIFIGGSEDLSSEDPILTQSALKLREKGLNLRAERSSIFNILKKTVSEKYLQSIIKGDGVDSENHIFVGNSFDSLHRYLLYRKAEGYVFLPRGGLEDICLLFEAFEMEKRRPQGQLNKPIILVGKSYWEPIMKALTEKPLADGLIKPVDITRYCIVDSAEEITKVLCPEQNTVTNEHESGTGTMTSTLEKYFNKNNEKRIGAASCDEWVKHEKRIRKIFFKDKAQADKFIESLAKEIGIEFDDFIRNYNDDVYEEVEHVIIERWGKEFSSSLKLWIAYYTALRDCEIFYAPFRKFEQDEIWKATIQALIRSSLESVPLVIAVMDSVNYLLGLHNPELKEKEGLSKFLEELVYKGINAIKDLDFSNWNLIPAKAKAIDAQTPFHQKNNRNPEKPAGTFNNDAKFQALLNKHWEQGVPLNPGLKEALFSTYIEEGEEVLIKDIQEVLEKVKVKNLKTNYLRKFMINIFADMGDFEGKDRWINDLPKSSFLNYQIESAESIKTTREHISLQVEFYLEVISPYLFSEEAQLKLPSKLIDIYKNKHNKVLAAAVDICLDVMQAKNEDDLKAVGNKYGLSESAGSRLVLPSNSDKEKSLDDQNKLIKENKALLKEKKAEFDERRMNRAEYLSWKNYCNSEIRKAKKEKKRIAREIAKDEFKISMKPEFVELHYPKILREVVDELESQFGLRKIRSDSGTIELVKIWNDGEIRNKKEARAEKITTEDAVEFVRDRLVGNDVKNYDERKAGARKIKLRTYEWGISIYSMVFTTLLLVLLATVPVFGSIDLIASVASGIIPAYYAAHEANIRTHATWDIDHPNGQRLALPEKNPEQDISEEIAQQFIGVGAHFATGYSKYEKFKISDLMAMLQEGFKQSEDPEALAENIKEKCSGTFEEYENTKTEVIIDNEDCEGKQNDNIIHITYKVECITKSSQGEKKQQSEIQFFYDKTSEIISLGKDVPVTLIHNLDSARNLWTYERMRIVMDLIEMGQCHLFYQWAEPGEFNNNKASVLDALIVADRNYPGGLRKYRQNALDLLEKSKAKINPFGNYDFSIPKPIETISRPEDSNFQNYTEKGLKNAAGKLAFVNLLGGIGSRLEYPFIKAGIPFSSLTMQTYLEYYCKNILAIQSISNKMNGTNFKIPYIIIASDSTAEPIINLLKKNGYFGLDLDQVQVLPDSPVPAFDINGNFALAGDKIENLDTGEEETNYLHGYAAALKTPGHGSVHQVLKNHGLVEKWIKEGRTHTVFFQDTNAQAFNIICSLFGISLEKGVAMNTASTEIAKGEPSGGIFRLNPKIPAPGLRPMITNVEYSYLQPMESELDKMGIKRNETPMNTNIFCLENKYYIQVLNDPTKIRIGEFCNPKWENEKELGRTKISGKGLTQVEMMMQDIAQPMSEVVGNLDKQIGYTFYADKRMAFSPVKNSINNARKKLQDGFPLDYMGTAEADYYKYFRKLLKSLNIDINIEGEKIVSQGLPLMWGAMVYLSPYFALEVKRLKEKIIVGSNVKISKESSLFIDGEGQLELQNFALNGLLRIIFPVGKNIKLKIRNIKIENTISEKSKLHGYYFRDLRPEEMDKKKKPELVPFIIRGAIRKPVADPHDLKKLDMFEKIFTLDLTNLSDGVYVFAFDENNKMVIAENEDVLIERIKEQIKKVVTDENIKIPAKKATALAKAMLKTSKNISIRDAVKEIVGHDIVLAERLALELGELKNDQILAPFILEPVCEAYRVMTDSIKKINPESEALLKKVEEDVHNILADFPDSIRELSEVKKIMLELMEDILRLRLEYLLRNRDSKAINEMFDQDLLDFVTNFDNIDKENIASIVSNICESKSDKFYKAELLAYKLGYLKKEQYRKHFSFIAEMMKNAYAFMIGCVGETIKVPAKELKDIKDVETQLLRISVGVNDIDKDFPPDYQCQSDLAAIKKGLSERLNNLQANKLGWLLAFHPSDESQKPGDKDKKDGGVLKAAVDTVWKALELFTSPGTAEFAIATAQKLLGEIREESQKEAKEKNEEWNESAFDKTLINQLIKFVDNYQLENDHKYFPKIISIEALKLLRNFNELLPNPKLIEKLKLFAIWCTLEFAPDFENKKILFAKDKELQDFIADHPVGQDIVDADISDIRRETAIKGDWTVSKEEAANEAAKALHKKKNMPFWLGKSDVLLTAVNIDGKTAEISVPDKLFKEFLASLKNIGTEIKQGQSILNPGNNKIVASELLKVINKIAQDKDIKTSEYSAIFRTFLISFFNVSSQINGLTEKEADKLSVYLENFKEVWFLVSTESKQNEKLANVLKDFTNATITALNEWIINLDKTLNSSERANLDLIFKLYIPTILTSGKGTVLKMDPLINLIKAIAKEHSAKVSTGAGLALPENAGLEKERNDLMIERESLMDWPLNPETKKRIKELSKKIKSKAREIAVKERKEVNKTFFVERHSEKYLQILNELLGKNNFILNSEDSIDKIKKEIQKKLTKQDGIDYAARNAGVQKIIKRTYEWGISIYSIVFGTLLTVLLMAVPLLWPIALIASIAGGIIPAYYAAREANVRTHATWDITHPITQRLVLPGIKGDLVPISLENFLEAVTNGDKFFEEYA